MLPIQKPAHLQAQLGIGPGLQQPVPGQQMTGIESISFPFKLRPAKGNHLQQAVFHPVASQIRQVHHLSADILAGIIVLIEHQGLEMLIELHPHQAVIV